VGVPKLGNEIKGSYLVISEDKMGVVTIQNFLFIFTTIKDGKY